MTIKVYPSLMPGEPIEIHEHVQCTIGEWFTGKGLDYQAFDAQPVSVTKNGNGIDAADWALISIGPDDIVEIRLIPHGGVFKALGSIIGKIFDVAFGWLMPSAKSNAQSQTEQGAQLETVNAKANAAKLGSVVPEIAGRFRRFPDYLVEPRRYFENAREQWLEFHACIGPGSYDIDPDLVKVGDTPFSSLGQDAEYRIFAPNESLEAYPTRDAWHTVSEVGGTSSGTAGLELSTEVGNRENADPSAYTFADNIVSRSAGGFPVGWGANTQVNVEYPRPYDVVTHTYPSTGEFDPAYDISRITGWFGHVPSTVGVEITIGTFDDEDRYLIRNVTDISAGVQMFELETLTEGEPVVIAPGTAQVLRFGSRIVRTLSNYSESAITLEPAGFESVLVAGARVRFASGDAYGEWSSEFALTPGNETTGVFEFDVFFPNGLAFIGDSGGLASRGVGIEFQYRDRDGGPRVTASWYYEQATLDQIGFTERIHTSQGRWMGRMRRIGAESTSTQVQDKVHWYGMKSLLASKWNYPNWTTMMVRLRSGGRLAAQSENQINLVATRRLPRLQDGVWSEPIGTSDISAFARHIAISIGYTDADINMEELQRLHHIWVARGDSLDHVFDQTTVKAALDLAFNAGLSELTIDDGQIKPVRDEPRMQFEQAYSPQNMTGPLRRTFDGPKPGDPDGVEVEYINADTWAKETVRCFLPGDQGFKLEKISADGVTNRDRAWRIGMRARRSQRYQRWSYSFKTEMDALNSSYLSYVPLLDDLKGDGQSSILEHIEPNAGGALLHLSEPMSWESGMDHVVAYRRTDGTLAGPYSATRGSDDFQVIAAIPIPWPEVTLKHEPPHVYFGTVERWCFPALITNIRPNGMDEVSVTAKNYHELVYTDDDNNAPT